MLMKEHLAEIDHIIHDLEQIENNEFDTHSEMNPLEHSKLMAKDAIDEFMTLLESLETDEFDHSGIIYDSLMIRKMSFSAYYMSRYYYGNLFRMGMTYEETCEECAKLIGCNPEGIIRMKTLYDNYFSIKEMGWSQVISLTDDMIIVVQECEGMTENEVAIACRMEFRKHSIFH